MNTTACKRPFSLGCVAHIDGAVFQTVQAREGQLAVLTDALDAWRQRSDEDKRLHLQEIARREDAWAAARQRLERQHGEHSRL